MHDASWPILYVFNDHAKIDLDGAFEQMDRATIEGSCNQAEINFGHGSMEIILYEESDE